MKLDEKKYARLLADLLAGQEEDGRAEPISPERLYQALTTGPALAPDERTRIWQSPLVRQDYLEAKRRIRAEIADRWIRDGVQTTLQAQAASTQTEVMAVDGPDFAVSIYRHHDEDGSWVVLLKLKRALLGSAYPLVGVRLVDSGGQEWLKGIPNSLGEISQEWTDSEATPADRLRSHELVLQVA